MALLKDLQKVAPGADTVAGRVVVFHNGKHLDLGQYVGDGSVVLSQEGEELLSPPVKSEIKPGRKQAPNLNAKALGGLDLPKLGE